MATSERRGKKNCGKGRYSIWMANVCRSLYKDTGKGVMNTLRELIQLMFGKELAAEDRSGTPGGQADVRRGGEKDNKGTDMMDGETFLRAFCLSGMLNYTRYVFSRGVQAFLPRGGAPQGDMRRAGRRAVGQDEEADNKHLPPVRKDGACGEELHLRPVLR